MAKTSWILSKANDWVNYVPCARPSVSELTEIEKMIQKMTKRKKRLKVAILGCTVEIRSLCHCYGCDVTLIEFSKAHHKIISKQQMVYKGKERLRFEDWRKMKTDIKYDLIIGDNVMNMLNNNDRKIVLKRVAKMLAPRGIFITRSYIRPKKLHKNLAEVLRFRNKKWPNVQIYTAAALDFFPLYTDPSTEFINMRLLLKDLKKANDKGELSKSEYIWLKQRFTKDRLGVTLPTLVFLENQMRSYFKVMKTYGIDVYARLQPIHILEMK